MTLKEGWLSRKLRKPLRNFHSSLPTRVDKLFQGKPGLFMRSWGLILKFGHCVLRDLS